MSNFISDAFERWEIRRFLKKAECAKFVIPLRDYWVITDNHQEGPRFGCDIRRLAEVYPEGAKLCERLAERSATQSIESFKQFSALNWKPAFSTITSLGFGTTTGSSLLFDLEGVYSVSMGPAFTFTLSGKNPEKTVIGPRPFIITRDAIEKYAPELLDSLPKTPAKAPEKLEWKREDFAFERDPFVVAARALCEEHKVNTDDPFAVTAFCNKVEAGEIPPPGGSFFMGWDKPARGSLAGMIFQLYTNHEKGDPKPGARQGTWSLKPGDLSGCGPGKTEIGKNLSLLAALTKEESDFHAESEAKHSARNTDCADLISEFRLREFSRIRIHVIGAGLTGGVGGYIFHSLLTANTGQTLALHSLISALGAILAYLALYKVIGLDK